MNANTKKKSIFAFNQNQKQALKKPYQSELSPEDLQFKKDFDKIFKYFLLPTVATSILGCGLMAKKFKNDPELARLDKAETMEQLMAMLDNSRLSMDGLTITLEDLARVVREMQLDETQKQLLCEKFGIKVSDLDLVNIDQPVSQNPETTLVRE